MEHLPEFMSCCRSLTADKATERRKQVDKFHQLLGKSYILKALDANTDTKQTTKGKTQLFAWDNVFKVTVDLLWLETDLLRKAKESTSSTAISNREKKKQEIGGLVKFVVKLTDKRGERLKCPNVVTHIIQVMQDPFTCSAYGLDYSSLLLKNILCVRKYVTELTPKMWHDLINIFTKMYRDPPSGFNRVILGRLIRTFVVGACQQCDVRPKRLLAFFTEIFKNIRQEKSTVVLEHLVAAMNALVQSAAANGRKQICRLGEDVFLGLLYLWNNRPTDVLKEEIIQFFHMQLLAHHPRGAQTEEKGAFAVDWELWKSHLRKLYEAVYTDLGQLGGRNKFTTGFREAVLKPLYVELVSNLCHQLFTGSSSVIEVTQIQTESLEITEPRAKKRRLESGWSALRDSISSTGQTMQAIPWLQLLRRLLEKYPESLPADDVNPLLEVLLQILTESKREEVVSYTLKCLQSIALAVRGESGHSRLHDKSLWDKVWAAGLRLISLHQSTRECFQLLTSMIKCKLITPAKDMWNLFFPNICTPSQEAVAFIAAYLPLYDLPDNYQPSLLGVSQLVNKGSYPLRKQLCDWLLLCREDLGELSRKYYCRVDQERLAEIMSVLTLRNCRSSCQQISSSTDGTLAEFDSPFDQHMQDLYLSSTFDLPSVSSEGSKDFNLDTVNNANVLLVFQHMQELFNKDVKSLLDIPEHQLSTVEWMAHRCCLAVKMIYKLTKLNVVTTETVLQLNLVDSLKILLKKSSSILVELLKREGIAHFLSVLSALENMMTFPDSGDSSVSYMMAELLRHISPARLVDCLMVQACEQPGTARAKAEPSTSRGGGRKNTSAVFDEFDLGFDDPPSDKEDVDEMDFGIDDSPEVDDSSDQSKVCCASLLSVESLTEAQAARLRCVRLLIKWCSYDRSHTGNTVIPSELRAETVKQKLLELLDDQYFDPMRSVDLHILCEVVFGLTANHHHIVEEDLQKILDAIRQMAKYHRRDQQVCAMTLDLVTAIVPYLAEDDDMVGVAKQECRDITLHLLSAYWKLQEDGQTVCQVRLAITKCLEMFIKYDPAGDWAVLHRSPTQAGDDGEVKIWEEFLVSLSDGSFMVRKYTAEALTCLFDGRQSRVDRSSDTRQNDLFNKMYDVIQDALSFEGKLTADEQEDEAMGRTSSLLLALSVVARHSPICEKRAVFTCCQLIKEKNLSINLVTKGLYGVATELGYQEVKPYLTSHLPYLINQWLDLEYNITEFPAQLMGYRSSTTFYLEHYHTIIPHIVMHKNMAAVQQMCQEMKADWLELVQECIPQTVVHILPLFATCDEGKEKERNAPSRQLSHASACYDLLIQAVSQQVVEKSIVSNLDQLVVNILMALHDPQEWDLGEASQGDQDPEPNPPYFNTDVITATLNYLTQSFSGNTKSLVSVLAKTQDAIQNVLLSLAIHISQARRCHEKRRILLMYRLFVKLLMKEFHGQLGGSWAFVLREVINRVVYIFVESSAQNTHHRAPDSPWEVKYQRSILGLCLDILYNICQTAMEHCHEELGKYLSWMVSHLLGYVNMEGELGTQVLQLLKYLCVESASTLRTDIASLDQFPDDPVCKDMRHVHKRLKYASGPFSLEQEIEHFLRAGQQQGSASENRKEGLRFLQLQLSERAEEITELMTRLADLPSENALCRLVSELVHLSRSTNEKIRSAASRCLGEIGPINLGLVSLSVQRHTPSLTQALTAYSDAPEIKKYCVIFHLLNDYLTDQCVDIVESSSNVLKAMMTTMAGQTFCADYKSRLDETDFLFKYLHPFRASKKMIAKVKSAQTGAGSVSILNDDTVWCPAHTDHNLWVTTLVTSLLSSGAVQDELLSLLAPICKVKTKFCEVVLPYLVHDILLRGSDEQSEVISRQMSSFFSLHCNLTASSQGSSRTTTPYLLNNIDQESICMNKESVHVMLSVVQYLRQQDRPKDSRHVLTPFDKNLWLDIDYLHVAKAAQNCSAYFTTLLYTELWCETQSKVNNVKKGGRRQSVSQSSRSGTQSQGDSQDWSQGTLGQFSTASASSGINVQEMMLEAYVSIGDPDGLYGCGAGRFADNMSRIKTYEHENKWDEALVAYTVEMNQPVMATQSGFLQALQNCGAYRLLDTYINCAGRENLTSDPEQEELRYEAAWRLGHWSLDVPNSLEAASGYHQSLYCALEALKEKQPARVISSFCDLARQVSLRLLNEASLESTRSLYPVLSKLHSLNRIDDLLQSDQSGRGVTAVLDRWGRVGYNDQNEFEFLEPTLTVQCRLLQILVERGHRERGVYVGVVQQLEKLVRMAREAGRYELAGHVIHQLKELETPEIEVHLSWQIEEACLYWARSEHATGKHLMKTLISKLDKMKGGNPEASRVFPHVLMMYGNWLAETRSDSPNIIMENYLLKAVEWLESHGDEGGFALDAYLSLARYADTQYQNIVNYMKSSTFESKQNLVMKAKEEMERYRVLADKKDRYLRTLEKQSEIDDAELAGLHEDRTSFLLRALESYIKCLKCGDKHDLRIFRVVSLWFDNASLSEVNEFILDAVDGVKTYKFLPLMYQLAARMSTSNQYHQLFKPTLDRLIERTAIEHPYQTLFIILALAHANKDTELLQARAGKRGKLGKSSSQTVPVEEDRVLAAKAMVEKLKMSQVSGVLQDMEKLCVAYIQLANWDVEQYKKETRPLPLPNSLKIMQMKNLERVVNPTVPTKVDPSCEYKDITHIVGFQPTFKLAGGVNLPKIITCICSDGQWRRQLVKGKDDLRQDAVMQQVFEMVNALLQKDAQTRKRKLKVRTYKVVPLSQRSGLLEWCEGTQPLGEYLAGNSGAGMKGAHARYRPQDLAPIDCRRKMTAVHDDRNLEKKHKVYLDTCAQFQPVFRHFFLEKYLDPAVWYDRRMAYTKSVATNSIVGYILGLGDRHVQNILIDCNTAELIHIDLGVAFEQGHILPTPETVPFRLTRDIVDGMGVAGVEGVFTRCCEKTMEVMHQNQESLLTILQVLLYDPLYTWTISPMKAYVLQHRHDRQEADTSDLNSTTGDLLDVEENKSSESQEKVNKLAERVLLRLHQKLQGIEDGVQLSVSGQVNHLIQEARDTKNLCKLFPGWQPYM